MIGRRLFEDVREKACDDRWQIQGFDLMAGGGDLKGQGLVVGVMLLERTDQLSRSHGVQVGRAVGLPRTGSRSSNHKNNDSKLLSKGLGPDHTGSKLDADSTVISFPTTNHLHRCLCGDRDSEVVGIVSCA
jgi:hypothetical protein